MLTLVPGQGVTSTGERKDLKINREEAPFFGQS